MKKSRKPNTTKKPPIPSDSHAEIDEWLRRAMLDTNTMVTYLDNEIRKNNCFTF